MIEYKKEFAHHPVKNQIKMTKCAKEVEAYLASKWAIGLLYTFSSFNHFFVYITTWKIYRELIEPESERICADYDCVPMLEYARGTSDRTDWVKARRADFAPKDAVRVTQSCRLISLFRDDAVEVRCLCACGEKEVEGTVIP